MISRRHFLKLSAAAGISLAVPWKVSLADRAAFSQSPALRKFLQPLPALGTDLPVALPTTDPNPIPGSRIVAMSFCEPRSWTRVLSS